jgi:hypothetical protein
VSGLPAGSLVVLFAWSFAAATILPLSSEARLRTCAAGSRLASDMQALRECPLLDRVQAFEEIVNRHAAVTAVLRCRRFGKGEPL